MEKNDEKIEEKKEEKIEGKILPLLKKEDWLIFELDKPVMSMQGQIEKLDLTGLRDLTLDDMVHLFDIYGMSGGDGHVMQETTMLFAKIAAQKVTGLTLEELGKLTARDAAKIKNRVYRFFYM